jgi:hypothetical protein
VDVGGGAAAVEGRRRWSSACVGVGPLTSRLALRARGPGRRGWGQWCSCRSARVDQLALLGLRRGWAADAEARARGPGRR